MNDSQRRTQIDHTLAELVALGGVSAIFSEVHENLFQRMLASPTMEVHQELFYIIKSLKEVESIITESVNRANTPEQDNN